MWFDSTPRFIRKSGKQKEKEGTKMKKITFKTATTIVKFKALIDGKLEDVVEIRDEKLTKSEAFKIMNEYQFVKDTLEVEQAGLNFRVPLDVLGQLILADKEKRFYGLITEEHVEGLEHTTVNATEMYTLELPKTLYFMNRIGNLWIDEIFITDEEPTDGEPYFSEYEKVKYITMPYDVVMNLAEMYEVKR